MKLIAQRIGSKIRRTLWPENGFLRRVDTVVHVGANAGQERDLYAKCDLDVVWIEPLPWVFEELQSRLTEFPKQRAFRALVTDRDGVQCIFHVSNNQGASSSIFDLADHRKMWPEVDFTHDLVIESITLKTLITRNGVTIGRRAALVLDTQGSELLILKGAGDLLGIFRYIKTEVADFDSYRGCCKLSDVTEFMKECGFREKSREPFAMKEKIGTYYDVLYMRR